MQNATKIDIVSILILSSVSAILYIDFVRFSGHHHCNNSDCDCLFIRTSFTHSNNDAHKIGATKISGDFGGIQRKHMV
jgi:hypothetical protein